MENSRARRVTVPVVVAVVIVVNDHRDDVTGTRMASSTRTADGQLARVIDILVDVVWSTRCNSKSLAVPKKHPCHVRCRAPFQNSGA